MKNLKNARLAVSSLTIYRQVACDGVVCEFTTMLESAFGVELRGFLEAYGCFFAALAASGSGLDFAKYLSEIIKYDDNAYTRQAASGIINESLKAAALNDMAVFNQIAKLTCEEIKSCAIENFSDDEDTCVIMGLPPFGSGVEKEVTPQATLAELEKFYRQNGCGRFAKFGAFRWQEGANGANSLLGIVNPDEITLSQLKGYEYERGMVVTNTLDFIEGRSCNNLLLYGDRGTGKSSTVKAVFNEFKDKGLRIIEISKDCIVDFSNILTLIESSSLKFIFFIDDLSFSQDDDNYTALKAVLEGGLEARPKNCVIYATSNRRHFVKESFSERQGDDVHAADAMQEKLSLSDRFGITITFSSPDQRLYFDIVAALAAERGLEINGRELELGAARWALRFNGRSPRAARQYIDWVESRLKQGQPVFDF